MSFYQTLKDINIFRILKPLIADGRLVWTEDNQRLRVNLKPDLLVPWHHIIPSAENRLVPDNDCATWKDVMFYNVVKTLPFEQRFVPSGCHDCYKVVVSINTVQQLFAMDKLMMELKYTSKCGIELRPTTFRNYGGYFYTRSLEEGQARHKEIKKLLSEHEVLNDCKVILKRGCTEYEMENVQGGTDKWVITDQQKAIESIFNEFVISDIEDWEQPPQVVVDAYQAWIQHACENVKDPTYLLFTDGVPLYPSYKTYEEGE